MATRSSANSLLARIAGWIEPAHLGTPGAEYGCRDDEAGHHPEPSENAMAQESARGRPVTQITVVEPGEGRLEEALSVMKERARYMAQQPGFISIILHRSTDGNRIVNYIQWQNRELLQKAHHSPEFRKKWDTFGGITDDIAPDLYEIEEVLTPQKTGGGGS